MTKYSSPCSVVLEIRDHSVIVMKVENFIEFLIPETVEDAENIQKICQVLIFIKEALRAKGQQSGRYHNIPYKWKSRNGL